MGEVMPRKHMVENFYFIPNFLLALLKGKDEFESSNILFNWLN